MLDQQPHPRALPPSSKQRFLSSISGVLSELRELLLSSPDPIEPNTGAQISQMLRAIREGASTHALDAITHTTADIETYLMSEEPFGPNGALRNFVLGSRVEELMERVAEASRSRRTPIQ